MTEAGAMGFSELLRMAGGLALVLGLVLIAGRIARRRMPGSGIRRLRVEERLPLGRGAQLVIVRAEDQRLLLGVAEKRIDVLTSLEDAVEDPSTVSEARASKRSFDHGFGAAQRFASMLSERLRNREQAS